MKKVLIIIAVSLLLFSCDKEKDKKACERNNTFSIELINSKTDPYEIYVNEKYVGTIAGKDKQTFDISAGYFKITFKQKSGYLLYPSVYDMTDTYSACERYYKVFP